MTNKILVLLSATLLLTGILGTLAGCNTIEGAGKDVERAGKAIKEEAREIKNKM